MDEAIKVSFEGVHERIDGVRSEVLAFRDDFKSHVIDDKVVADQVKDWAGALRILIWLVGVILGLATAHVAKHW